MENRLSLAARIDRLFATVKPCDGTDRTRSGGEYFNADIAALINGPLAGRIAAVIGSRVSISAAYIGELRRGIATDPRRSHLVALAIAFNVSPSVLLDDDIRVDRIDICLAGLRLIPEPSLLRLVLHRLVEQSGLSSASRELIDQVFCQLLSLEGFEGSATEAAGS